MAKETVTRLVDDLDGGVAHETVTFGLDGHTYEIDLSAKNAKRLRSELSTFVERGTRVPKRTGPGRQVRRSTVGSTEQNRAIRDWAQRKGYDVGPRGRIKADIVEAFNNEHDR